MFIIAVDRKIENKWLFYALDHQSGYEWYTPHLSEAHFFATEEEALKEVRDRLGSGPKYGVYRSTDKDEPDRILVSSPWHGLAGLWNEKRVEEVEVHVKGLRLETVAIPIQSIRVTLEEEG